MGCGPGHGQGYERVVLNEFGEPVVVQSGGGGAFFGGGHGGGYGHGGHGGYGGGSGLGDSGRRSELPAFGSRLEGNFSVLKNDIRRSFTRGVHSITL